MNKKSLIMFLGLIMILAACSSEESTVKDKENSKEQPVIDINKDVTKITVTGPLGLFSDTKEQQQKNGKVYLQNPEEIEVVVKAIEGSSPPSGPIADDGPNFEIILSYKDKTSETFHWWVYTDSSHGKIQNASEDGPTHILKEEDVKNMTKLLDKKVN